MADQILHRSKRHPDLASWNARARTVIDRKAPATDNGLHPVVTFTYSTTEQVEMDAWQTLLDTEIPMVTPRVVENGNDDRPTLHELDYATELTLNEINEVGGFIVTRNKFYC